MARHLIISLSFLSIIILCISAEGRSLENKNHTTLSHSHFRVKAVSRATSSYTGLTNENDAWGLSLLATTFPLLDEYTTDACLSPKVTWIECNSDPRPRVIALNLGGRQLFGYLPDFSIMDALQRIDLSRNSLVGTVPTFLGTFPDLKELNLASNIFYGVVPDSIACNKNLTLSIAGNSGLSVSNSCARSTSNTNTGSRSSSGGGSSSSSSTGDVSYPSTRPTKKKSKLPIVLGSTISLLAVIGIGVGGFATQRHKAKAAAAIAAANATPAGLGPKEGAAISPNVNMPAEERPINTRPIDMSP